MSRFIPKSSVIKDKTRQRLMLGITETPIYQHNEDRMLLTGITYKQWIKIKQK